MSGPAPTSGAYSLDAFLQALVSQLDDVQDNLALKAKAGRPVTWALKDLTLDLQVFLEVGPGGEVRMRTAAPNETGASSLRVELSTITREMIEENTYDPSGDGDSRPIEQHLADPQTGLASEHVRRLKSVGVRTVGQFLRLQPYLPQVAQQTGIPLQRLQQADAHARRPALLGLREERAVDGTRLLRLLGANLSDGRSPEVRVCGEPVEVLEARRDEVVVRPARHHREGQVELRAGQERVTGWLRDESPADPAWGRDPWAGGGR